VTNVAIDKRARVAAIVRAVGSSGDEGTRAELWSLAQPRPQKPLWRVPLAADELVSDVAISPDGRRVLVVSTYGLARLFDAVTRKPLRTLVAGTVANAATEAFYRATFSPNGDTVAVGGSRDVRLWDVASGAERSFRLSGHTSVLRSVTYSADGRRIVTASADGTVRVWDAARGTALTVSSHHSGRVNGAAMLPGGWIVSGGDDRTVRAYPCESCGSFDSLIDAGARRVTRDLSDRDLTNIAG
jgi:WD40 repeat protein